MKIFCQPVRPEDVGELVDLTVENDPNSCSMAQLQLEGIAAIYNILCRQNFAYLADEVGMGKTYQALGVAAMVWNECPDARILFLSPRQNLQIKWHSDYIRFFSSNYRRNQRLGDDRAVSILLRQPIHRPEIFHNLRSWLPTLGMPEPIAPVIRHTSFTRPVFLNKKDFLNKSALWAKVSNQLRCCGLFEFDRPDEITDNNASLELNLMFANALNAKLKNLSEGRRPYFDLVIVDEAQFLRNPQNQTNQVFYSIFQHNVAKWLFMSATPAHSGPEDFHKILNHYPGVGEVLDSTLVEDLEYLQKELQKFLVRRSREYTTSSDSTRVGKEEYRNHDAEGWAIRDGDMQVLDTLSIAVVQKGLVNVLQRRNNRYHIGFLSSFESLQSSLAQTKLTVISDSDGHDETTSGDWHHDQQDGLIEGQAPDTNFINDLAERFEKKFQIPLRHPKVDYVADRVAELAFGTGTQLGGHKFLVFTRRVSTVDALCKRLMTKYLESIEDRVHRCWGERIDWSTEGIDTEDLEDSEDPETFEEEFSDDRLRDALSKKGWLFRYRQTFRAQGRNSHFFEDGWLQRLCEAGEVLPEEAAERLPRGLWAKSWTHASSASSRGHNRAKRMRYLAVNTIRSNPEVFGLNDSSAKPWRKAYELALHEHIDNGTADGNDTAHEAPELFAQPTLWTEWDKRFSTGPLELPVRVANHASKKHSHDELINELCRRQVIRVLIGQIFRLTDTIVDLYYADKRGKRDTNVLPRQFLDWLVTEDWSAVQVRTDCERWIQPPSCHSR